MDPVTAFQTAAAVFQFAGVLYNVATTAYDIYNSTSGLDRQSVSLSREADNIDNAASSVEAGLATLRSCTKLDKDEKRVEVAARRCLELSSSITGLINRLRLGSHHRVSLALKLSIRSSTKRMKLQGMKEELAVLREELETALLINIWRKVDAAQVDNAEILRRVDSAVVQQARDYTQTGSKLEQILTQVQNVQSTNVAEHQKTQKLIQDTSNRAIDQDALKQLINDLSFGHLDSRQQLKDPYPDTCDWIWIPPLEHQLKAPWSDFPQWLESGDSIYWVNGKAGCGKSTLMNYLSEHEDFHTRLATWANGRRCITPMFFFWRLGSIEQKSIEGLLRSLLVQTLEGGPSGSPGLMESILSNVQGQQARHGLHSNRHFWNTGSLFKVLETIIHRIEGSCSICFLIDGVDEFEGSPEDQQRLFELLRTLSRKRNVKVCLSSRPDRQLIQAFGECPQLRLQDFNYVAILKYVERTLRKEPRMKELLAQYPQLVRVLSKRISCKAEGVFLWAYFAVGEVLKGLWAIESPEDLKTRVESLSSSLHGIFRQMLSGLEEQHLDELALILELMRRFEDYDFQYAPLGDPPLLLVALVLGKGAFSNASDLWTTLVGNDPRPLLQALDKWQENLLPFSRAIRARGSGFFDVSTNCMDSPTDQFRKHEHQDLIVRVMNRPLMSISLVHRSVLDFLTVEEDASRTIGARMRQQGDHLDKLLSVINGALHCVGIRLLILYMENTVSHEIIHKGDNDSAIYSLDSIWSYWLNCMMSLHQLQARKGDHTILRESIDLVDRCMSSLDMNRFCEWEFGGNFEVKSGATLAHYISDFRLGPDSWFLMYSTVTGLYSVVLTLLPRVPIAQRSSIASAGFASLIGSDDLTCESRTCQRTCQRTFVCLMALGADCNRKLEALGGRSCWEYYLSRLVNSDVFHISNTHNRHTAPLISYSRIFINAGASLSTTVACRICHQQIKPRYTNITASVRYLLEHLLPGALQQSLRPKLPLIRWREEPVVCRLESVEECDESGRFSCCFYGDSMTIQEHADFGSVLLNAAAAPIDEESGPKLALEEFIDSMMLKYHNRRRLPRSTRRFSH